MSNSSIWLIDWILSYVTTLGQSRLGSNGNEGVHRIPQLSKAVIPLSDCLESYAGHSLGGV